MKPISLVLVIVINNVYMASKQPQWLFTEEVCCDTWILDSSRWSYKVYFSCFYPTVIYYRYYWLARRLLCMNLRSAHV